MDGCLSAAPVAPTAPAAPSVAPSERAETKASRWARQTKAAPAVAAGWEEEPMVKEGAKLETAQVRVEWVGMEWRGWRVEWMEVYISHGTRGRFREVDGPETKSVCEKSIAKKAGRSRNLSGGAHQPHEERGEGPVETRVGDVSSEKRWQTVELHSTYHMGLPHLFRREKIPRGLHFIRSTAPDDSQVI